MIHVRGIHAIGEGIRGKREDENPSLSSYARRPIAFFGRYIRRRPIAHSVILAAVLGAVGCSVGTQYGVKFLVDVLAGGPAAHGEIWAAFTFLVSLVAADNLLWRVAGWVASSTFTAVTGDLRADLFRHLTGHSPAYFADRLPGMLTGRVTATSEAAFAIENMFIWNVLPPCVATIGAIAFLALVSPIMSGSLAVISIGLMILLFRLAAAGRPLHHDFAGKAATVSGEMMDVIDNIIIVRAFDALRREHRRFDHTVGRETKARQTSLLYLERLRLFHACVTILITVAILAWAIILWQHGKATAGSVVLVCTLGFTILHATRDLAVALVDMTQHMARLSEALATLLVPHELTESSGAKNLETRKGNIDFEGIGFHYPNGKAVFRDFTLHVAAGQKVGLVGPSGGGKSTLLALIQRLYEAQSGRIFIDGQDIAHAKQESLRAAISVVLQDVSLLHRSILENIRYGCPDASDEAVVAVARAARCMEFIEALPEGFSTLVGDRGVKLSGGQRQRIAIARALLKDAPILLLDEATSALDAESERTIREAMERLMRGRTVVAIAHRLSTLRDFDRIVVLADGRIIEDGHPDILMRRAGPYRTLVEREFGRLAG